MLFASPRKKREEGEQQLIAIIASNPDHACAHSILGQYYAVEEQWDLAQKHLETALKLDPGDAMARQFLSSIPKDRILTKTATGTVTHLQKAEELFVACRIDEAIVEYKLAIEENPQNWVAYTKTLLNQIASSMLALIAVNLPVAIVGAASSIAASLAVIIIKNKVETFCRSGAPAAEQ